MAAVFRRAQNWRWTSGGSLRLSQGQPARAKVAAMRVFLRLGADSERIMTLDLHPDTTIQSLKLAVIESGQAARIASSAQDMIIRCQAAILNDNLSLQQCATPEQGRALHVVLTRVVRHELPLQIDCTLPSSLTSPLDCTTFLQRLPAKYPARRAC